MFGFLFGAACLAGLIHHKRRLHGFRGGGRRRGHGRRHRGFKRRLLRHKVERMLDVVDASDDQAREIHDIVDELTRTLFPLKDELRAGRHGMVDAVRADDLNEVELDAVFETQRDVVTRAQTALKHALQKMHATLDADQRAQLFDLFGHRATSGPYR